MPLTQRQVSELYVSIFNRAGEGEGNSYWQGLGFSASETVEYMLHTTDAAEYFGNALSTNRAFVEHIYANTLNKTAAEDEDGIAYWTGLLNSGHARGTVVSGLIDSIASYAPGAQNYNPNDIATVVAYNQFANRVEVADYTAATLFSVPANYKLKLGFDWDLEVSDDDNTVELAKDDIDLEHQYELENENENENDDEDSYDIIDDLLDSSEVDDFLLGLEDISELIGDDLMIHASPFEFTAQWLNGKTLYNVYDDNFDGKYEGLMTMVFNNGTVVNSENGVTETLAYTVDEHGILAMSDSVDSWYLVAYAENTALNATEIAYFDNDYNAAISAVEDYTYADEYMFWDLASVESFLLH